jgi:large subunit ribosomal protein L25
MDTQVTLKAEEREGRGKGAARRLRATGRVPAVLYGADLDSLALSVDAAEATHLFQSISVENTIVDLAVEGQKEPVQTLVREVQVHPIRPQLLHIDFFRIQAGVKVDVEIPIHLIGVPEGVRAADGVLQQVIHELPVRVLPSNIPPSVEIDVTALELGDAIHVSDLDLGEDIEIQAESDQTIAAVVAPRAPVLEEEEEELEEGEVELVGEEVEGEEAESRDEDEDENED